MENIEDYKNKTNFYEFEEFEEFDGFEELECFDDRAKWKSTGWIDLGSDKHENPIAKILEYLERQRYVEEE